MRLYKLVKKCIDRWDPMSLLASGCPKDEYNPESKMISERIDEESSVQEIGKVISDIMSKQFGSVFDLDACIDVAKDIYDSITNAKYQIETMDSFEMPFGIINVYVNGEKTSFQIRQSPNNRYPIDWENNKFIRIDTTYDILIKYDELKKGDLVEVRSTAGGLEYDGGGEHYLEANAQLKDYTYGFGCVDVESLEYDFTRAFNEKVHRNYIIPYDNDSLEKDCISFVMTDDPKEFKYHRFSPNGILLRLAWMKNSDNDNTLNIVSFLLDIYDFSITNR